MKPTLRQKIRTKPAEWYWRVRLLGYGVADAKWVICKHSKRWHFVVRNNKFIWDDSKPFDSNRLHLWTDETVGRIVWLTIR